MKEKKVAVVTGANKGLGFAIVKDLCQNFQGNVYLTAKNENKGRAAVKELEELGFHPFFHQLDVTDQSSVDKFKQHIQNTYGGLDLLINNAMVIYPRDARDPPLAEQAEEAMQVNYYGTIRLCDAVFPLLRTNASVVNISSSARHFYRIPYAEVRTQFSDPELTIEKLTALIEKFINDAKEYKTDEEGWGPPPYCCHIVSNGAVCALTSLQQTMFDNEESFRNISINAVHPGIIKTDLNPTGILTPEQGAKSILYVIFNTSLKGKYIFWDYLMEVFDLMEPNKVVDWYGETITTGEDWYETQ